MNDAFLNDFFYIALHVDKDDNISYVSNATTMYGSNSLSKKIELLDENIITRLLESSDYFKNNLIIFECSLIKKSKIFYIGNSIGVENLKNQFNSLINFNDLEEQLKKNNRKKDMLI